MKQYLDKLERKLNDLGCENESLLAVTRELSVTQKTIGEYKVFGDNILEVSEKKFQEKYSRYNPMSVPFRFFDFQTKPSEANDFIAYDQFKTLVPENYELLGFLNGSEIIVVNEKNSKIYKFNFSDLADIDFLKYLVKTPICTLNGFLKDLKPQTVICLGDPKNSAKYERLEISKDLWLYHEIDPLSENHMFSDDYIIPDEQNIVEEYYSRINSCLERGYEIIYAPQFVWKKLGLTNPKLH
jgi:hypothetical protein